MQLKSSVLSLLALVSLAAANAHHLGYEDGYFDSLDTRVQQGVDAVVFDSDITEQGAGDPVSIVPSKGANKCLDVRNAVFQNGTPVQIYDCNGTNGQKWVINDRSGHIRVYGTNFCLDVGAASPHNGDKLKIWTCSNSLTSQIWGYRADNTIQMQSANKCVDLTGGSLVNGKQTQVWICNGSRNQMWLLWQ